MQDYYLLVIVGAPILLAIGTVWFVIRRKKLKVSNQTPENDLINDYSYNSASAKTSDPLFIKLRKVSLESPETREPNEMDEWFRNATPELCHSGICLSYLNDYRVLQLTFWKNVADLGLKLDQDEKFQRLLISVYSTSFGHYENFRYLTFHFAKRFSLLPQIEEILNTDTRFSDTRITYEFGRKVAKEDAKRKKYR